MQFHDSGEGKALRTDCLLQSAGNADQGLLGQFPEPSAAAGIAGDVVIEFVLAGSIVQLGRYGGA